MRRTLGLALMVAMVWLALPATSANAGGGGCYGPVSKAHTTTIEMKDMCFFPTVAIVEKGSSLTFVNRDGMKHYVSGANGTWSTRVIRRGVAATVDLDKEGVYPYFCPYHWSMQGVIVVGDGLGPGSATKKAVKVTRYVRPERPDPLPTPEPQIVRVPERVEVERDPNPLSSAALVWGGAGAGLLGGFLINRVGRRKPGEP